jgi:DNA-binding beta-propeller fold protein YncE
MKWGTMGAVAAEFQYPADIVIDTAGDIYVLDSDNHRVQKFNSEGTWLSQFGSYGAGDGQLSYPWGLDADAEGRVYISDTNNDRIQVFDANGVRQGLSTGNSIGRRASFSMKPKRCSTSAMRPMIASTCSTRTASINARLARRAPVWASLTFL